MHDSNTKETVTSKYIILFNLCNSTIILTRSPSTQKQTTYPGTKLVGVEFRLRKGMKNSPSSVHVLHKTLNLVISHCCFAEFGREMYQNLKCMCRVIVFAH